MYTLVIMESENKEPTKPIVFNDVQANNHFLSNWYCSDIVIDGKTYQHVEGYIQSSRFIGINDKAAEHIRNELSPLSAQMIAKNKYVSDEKRDKDSGLKLYNMKRAVMIKFLTNEELLDKLLKTESAEIRYKNNRDEYWGIGKDGNGHNGLGKVLMGVRKILQGTKGEYNNM